MAYEKVPGAAHIGNGPRGADSVWMLHAAGCTRGLRWSPGNYLHVTDLGRSAQPTPDRHNAAGLTVRLMPVRINCYGCYLGERDSPPHTLSASLRHPHRNNAAEMFVDVTKSRSDTGTQWIAESGVVDLFVFTGATGPAVLASYAKLSGTTALPQLFSLGYHQCRWNYKVGRGANDYARKPRKRWCLHERKSKWVGREINEALVTSE